MKLFKDKRTLMGFVEAQPCWMDAHTNVECACALDGVCPLKHDLYVECVRHNQTITHRSNQVV